MHVKEDEDGGLDDFYVESASVHFEAMSDNSWWIGVRTPDGRGWHINCGAVNPRAAGFAFIQEQ